MSARIYRGGLVRPGLIAMIGTIVIFSVTPRAHAAEIPTATVRYSVKEADTGLGAQRLYRRLQAASRAVCRPYQSKELARLSLYNSCYQQALARAVATVDLASLRDVYRDHNVRVADMRNRSRPAG